MTEAQCSSGCGAPAGSTYLCDGCTDKLRRDLKDVTEGLLDDLQVSYLRQARFSSLRSARSSDDVPLPWDERAASTTSAAIDHAVHRWARMVIADDPVNAPLRDYLVQAGRDVEAAHAAARHGKARRIQQQINRTRFDTPSSTAGAAWLLLDRLAWLRTHVEVGEAFTELHRTIGRAVRAVDCPPSSSFVGVCPGDWPEAEACGAALYGRKAKQHRCAECGRLWNTADLRPYFLAQARDWLATATEISRALGSLEDDDFGGIRATPERIRKWKQRGRLQVRGRLVRKGRDGADIEQPLYRVGDVEDLLKADAPQRETKEAV